MAKEALTSTLTATVPTTTTTTDGQTDGRTEEQEVRVEAEVREARVERAKGEDNDAEKVFDGQVRCVEQMLRSDGQSNVVERIQSLFHCACVVQTAPPFRALRSIH